MTKNKIARYVANTALFAVLAAAGIGVYQLGTAPLNETKIQDEASDEIDAEESEDVTEEEPVQAEVSQTDADQEAANTDVVDEEKVSGAEEKSQIQEKTEQPVSQETTDTNSVEETTAEVSANAVAAPKLNFSEDTLMDWPINGSVLLDYNMDQTVYFPTLDQYKLSPAIAVGAVEGAPVTSSVRGTVYSIEEDPQTGTTLTMELGSGYQAIYGQLKDITVSEGETVEKGTVIGYINAPTKYYSNEGSNLYFALKKNGEPIDPIAYLP